MSTTLKVVLWSLFYTLLLIGIITGIQVGNSIDMEAESKLEIHRVEAEKLRREYAREDRVRRNEQRGARDKAFVECVNAIGLEQCGVISDWVEPDERVKSIFGAVK